MCIRDSGQVLTATDELGGVISYVYDANGRLIEMTDAMGGKTAYAYDAVSYTHLDVYKRQLIGRSATLWR